MKTLIIAIPAYNEEKIIEKNMIKLHDFCKKNIKNYNWKIIIGNNASQDKTLEILKNLNKKYPKIDFIDRKARGKSEAIKEIYFSQDADIFMYMDADLSTDIKHISDLIEAIEQGYDIATGSRTSPQIETSRNFNRHIISTTLIKMLQIIFSLELTDFQCGFKAINKRTRDNILPKMRNISKGFMDTEMLIVANKKKYKIKEIPVLWKDERKSQFNISASVLHFLKNITLTKLNLISGRYN